MPKIYFKGTLIVETTENDVQEAIDNYTARVEAEIRPLLNKIKILENTIDDLYPKRDKDTPEEYLVFLRKVNPEYIEALEELGRSVFGDRFMGLYILAPNTIGALLSYMTEDNYMDRVSIAVLRERLKGRIPKRRTIEIMKE